MCRADRSCVCVFKTSTGLHDLQLRPVGHHAHQRCSIDKTCNIEYLLPYPFVSCAKAYSKLMPSWITSEKRKAHLRYGSISIMSFCSTHMSHLFSLLSCLLVAYVSHAMFTVYCFWPLSTMHIGCMSHADSVMISRHADIPDKRQPGMIMPLGLMLSLTSSIDPLHALLSSTGLHSSPCSVCFTQSWAQHVLLYCCIHPCWA